MTGVQTCALPIYNGKKRKIMYLFIEDVGKVMRKKSFLNREIAINGEI